MGIKIPFTTVKLIIKQFKKRKMKRFFTVLMLLLVTVAMAGNVETDAEFNSSNSVFIDVEQSGEVLMGDFENIFLNSISSENKGFKPDVIKYSEYIFTSKSENVLTIKSNDFKLLIQIKGRKLKYEITPISKSFQYEDKKDLEKLIMQTIYILKNTPIQ